MFTTEVVVTEFSYKRIKLLAMKVNANIENVNFARFLNKRKLFILQEIMEF